jgi:hypothetical protein
MRLASPSVLPFALALALAAAPLAAQASPPFAVGVHDVAWPNLSGLGTPTLAARVCYPSPTGGSAAPIAANVDGWPVVVVLHGYGLLGRDYAQLGRAWAEQGLAVVLLDTAPWSYLDQVADGIAVHDAIVAASRAKGTFFAGAFDVTRIAIAGHSMGGGTLGVVLLDNPGYRCGFALAPVSPGNATAAQITVPFGIVVGTGDPITPWNVFALPYYQSVAPHRGLKFGYVMGPGCDHLNVAGLAGPQDPAFLRVVDLGLGFFRHFLDLDECALERCIGLDALAEPQLVQMRQQIVEPRVWLAERLLPGTTVRVSLAAEEGPGIILAAPRQTAGVDTPLGRLLLDPAGVVPFASGFVPRTCRFDAWLTVPASPALVGTSIAMQAVGATPSLPLRLGAAATFTVGS